MLSKPIKHCNCGCGAGRDHCITKKLISSWIDSEMKKLDCGCGCKGKKWFDKKYGLVGGNILADCPPGWRNDGLTCVEPCKEDEHDDGLTCRKKCPPGQIDDGLTCRVPITSSMNECPPGSRDIAGTCWGPVRKDCVDDCFKHPAPGCRTYECGRLRGAFGEDWGPKLCTDCNLRCGQTCWDVQGITKQLHERQLRIMGGEVFGQAIRSKQIRGRVNFDKLVNEIGGGIKDLFEGNIDLAKAFDPERNGIANAFRKFGDDMKSVLEEVGRNIKIGFDEMGAAAKGAFEEMARNAERDFKQFGEDFVHKMKDPDFWVEAIGIMAMVAAAAVSIAITVGTLGVGSPAAIGLMAAASMAGPAARMIAAAARNEPIDALDIAAIVIAGAGALVPGMGPMMTKVMNIALPAASFAISAVNVGQSLGVIPSTCIANCPPPPPRPPFPPVDPPEPSIPSNEEEQPAPAGQKSYKEIADLQQTEGIHTLFSQSGKNKYPGDNPPKRPNPNFLTTDQWVAKYRAENYGPDSAPDPTGPGGNTESPGDQKLEGDTNITPGGPEMDNGGPDKSAFPDFGDEYPPFPGSGDEYPPFPGFENTTKKPEEKPEEKPVIPEGQLTDAQIEKLQPENTLKLKIKVGTERVDNPDYLSPKDWIAKYRAEHYGTKPEAPSDDIPAFPGDTTDDIPSFPGETPSDDIPAFPGFPGDTTDDIPDFPGFPGEPPVDDIPDFPGSEEQSVTIPTYGLLDDDTLEGGIAPESLPLITPNISGDVTSNPWGLLSSTAAKSNIPKAHDGTDFNPTCYARENPEVAAAVGNDPGRLTTHWIEKGSKEGLNGSCVPSSLSKEERLAAAERLIRELAQYEGLKNNCAATDRFWVDAEKRCDGHRHADGRANTAAQECKESNSWWDTSGTNSVCIPYRTATFKIKTRKERCNDLDGFYDGQKCIQTRNVDGSNKTPGDVCTGLNNFWNDDTKVCDVTRDRDGTARSDKELCDETGNYFQNGKCNNRNDIFGKYRNNADYCFITLGNTLNQRTGICSDKNKIILKPISQAEMKTRVDELTKDLGSQIHTSESIQKDIDDAKILNRLNEIQENMATQRAIMKSRFDQDAKNNRLNPSFRPTPLIAESDITFDLIKELDEGIDISNRPNLNFVNEIYNIAIQQYHSEHPDDLKSKEKHQANLAKSYTSRNQVSNPNNQFGNPGNPFGRGKPGKSLTLYYADWCHFCHEIMPIWNKLGSEYKGIKIQKFEEKQTKVKVDGYPTILFRSGKSIEKYNGPRTKAALVNFLKNKL